jgi:hypothetical protein
MPDRSSEDAIRADLRLLTERTRKLRQELEEFVAHRGGGDERDLAHDASVPAATANERQRRGRKKR